MSAPAIGNTVRGMGRSFGREAFASLENPNYRLYFSGQVVSMVGNWMQTVGQSWLVLQLTGSATMIGLVVALQTLPVLLLGPYGGVIADRVDKRKMMIVLQAGKLALALILGLLAISHTVQIWHVFLLAGLLGLDNSFENPARQAFVQEMVGREHLRNAVSLNQVIANGARAVGPAGAGILIASAGVGVCFLANAASFVAVISSLVMLNTSKLMPSPPAPRAKGQVREGFRYVRRTPALAIPLVMTSIIGCLAYEFQVVLPIVAKETFHGDSRTYGFMTAAMGAGAIAGGLWAAARGRTGTAPMIRSAVGFGLAILATSIAPTFFLALVAMVFVGFTSVTYLTKGSSTVQLATDPMMRGRVMALWAVAFMGSTPIGGPAVGWVCEQFGARAGLVLGGLACLVAAGLGWMYLRSAAGRREIAAEAAALEAAKAAPLDIAAEAAALEASALEATALEAAETAALDV
ncbi:MAG: MFS transporter, partial [Frankiaceae bacterium]|nr:MFS transporter [Frankiaceae bacterium]